MQCSVDRCNVTLAINEMSSYGYEMDVVCITIVVLELLLKLVILTGLASNLIYAFTNSEGRTRMFSQKEDGFVDKGCIHANF